MIISRFPCHELTTHMDISVGLTKFYIHDWELILIDERASWGGTRYESRFIDFHNAVICEMILVFASRKWLIQSAVRGNLMF